MADLSLEAIANAYSDYSEEKDLSLESIMTRNGALDVISPYRQACALTYTPEKNKDVHGHDMMPWTWHLKRSMHPGGC